MNFIVTVTMAMEVVRLDFDALAGKSKVSFLLSDFCPR